MGQCTSRSKPPKVLIPDPEPDAQCTFTIKQHGHAEEHVVHKGVSTEDRTKWLLFTRQFTGSGNHDPQLENFVRALAAARVSARPHLICSRNHHALAPLLFAEPQEREAQASR